MAITKLFDESELSEIRKKCEGDAQLQRLLNFYLLNDSDGVAAFERSLNNALHVFADHIDTQSDNFIGIKKDDLDRLLEIGVEGSKMAKNLKELRRKINPVGRPAAKEVEGDEIESADDKDSEEQEELDTDSLVDRRARKMMNDRI